MRNKEAILISLCAGVLFPIEILGLLISFSGLYSSNDCETVGHVLSIYLGK